jgi:hypothetical protein
MQAQFEYDLLGYPPRSSAAAIAAVEALEESLSPSKTAGRRGILADADDEAPMDSGAECDCGDDECGEEDDEADADGEGGDGDDTGIAFDEEDDPLHASAGPDALAETLASAAEDEAASNNATASPDSVNADVKGSRARSRSRSRSAAPKALTSDRLAALSKPREVKEPEKDTFVPEKKPEKVKQKARPSLIMRVKPTNLEEQRERFFASGCTEAPQFTYASSDEAVTKLFAENSNVCFELLPEAKRIIQRVHDEYGGPEAFLQKLYGDAKSSPAEMKAAVEAYVKDLGVEDKVDIRIVESAMSAANVVKPGFEGKYIVNIANAPISTNLVPGICDHEVGTHLLRMMNDEHQVWHCKRDRYGMINPWTTEEGFATLNT